MQLLLRHQRRSTCEQAIMAVISALCAADPVRAQSVLDQRPVHAPAAVDCGIRFGSDFRYIKDVIEMAMGNQNLVRGRYVRWFQDLSWEGLLVTGKIRIDEKCSFAAFNFEPGSAKPCEFHAAPRGVNIMVP